MKKSLAVFAVLAVAAVAQAELLGTWTLQGGDSTFANNTSAANYDKVTFGNLTRADGMGRGASSGSMFSANGWNNDRAIGFTIDVAADYEIAAGATLHASAINGTQGAPNTLQWKLDGTAVGSAWTLSTASGSSTISDVVIGSAIDDSKQHTMALTYTQPGRINSATANAAADGNVRLYGPMTIDGKIQEAAGPTPQVPEPATMSLLGLGALAMALRRKLRK